MTVRPVVIHTQPKDIEEIQNLFGLVQLPKVSIKYVPYAMHPYRLVQEVFLKMTKGTHLLLWPNDLVVSQQNIDKLIATLESTDFDVACGVCNVDEHEYKEYWNVTRTMPAKDFSVRKYEWTKIHTAKEGSMIKCGYSGFPLMSMSRRLLNEVSLHGDCWDGHVDSGTNTDLAFCWDMHERGTPIWADPNNVMIHRRHEGALQTGKKRPEVEILNYKIDCHICRSVTSHNFMLLTESRYIVCYDCYQKYISDIPFGPFPV